MLHFTSYLLRRKVSSSRCAFCTVRLCLPVRRICFIALAGISPQLGLYLHQDVSRSFLYSYAENITGYTNVDCVQLEEEEEEE